MGEEKITVVVPAYNNAPWLPRCLDSLLNQTHQNLEIIVVNDGSTDDTASVLEMYAARDSRVKPVHKENGGVTSARLRGVAEAAGDWVGFVDGDDEVEPDMYARLLKNARAYGADISHCGYQVIYPDGGIEYLHNSGVLRQQDWQTGLRDLLEEKIVEPGLCNKLFKKALFRHLESKMDLSIRNNEDFLMNYYLFAQAKLSVFEDFCPYHYRIRQGSASRRKLNAHMIYDPIHVRQTVLESCAPELKDDARRALARMCLVAYRQLVLEKGKEYEEDRRNVRRMLAEQKPYLHLLPPRNALLVRTITTVPWLFDLAYRAFVKIFG